MFAEFWSPKYKLSDYNIAGAILKLIKRSGNRWHITHYQLVKKDPIFQDRWVAGKTDLPFSSSPGARLGVFVPSCWYDWQMYLMLDVGPLLGRFHLTWNMTPERLWLHADHDHHPRCRSKSILFQDLRINLTWINPCDRLESMLIFPYQRYRRPLAKLVYSSQVYQSLNEASEHALDTFWPVTDAYLRSRTVGREKRWLLNDKLEFCFHFSTGSGPQVWRILEISF